MQKLPGNRHAGPQNHISLSVPPMPLKGAAGHSGPGLQVMKAFKLWGYNPGLLKIIAMTVKNSFGSRIRDTLSSVTIYTPLGYMGTGMKNEFCIPTK